ncbi:MAG TPA: ABC transporter ATP-binding protein [Ktedonobacterales bacterium]
MKTLRAVQGYMLRRWPTLTVGLVLVVIANLVALVPAIILQQVVDSVSHGADARALSVYALEIIGIAIGAGGLQFLARFVVNAASRRVEYEMRRDLFRHFQRMDVAYFQDRKIGDLVARATNDLSQVRQMLGPGLTNLANSLVAFTVTGLAMISIDARLTLYSLTVMPLMTVFFIFVSGSIQRRYRLVQDQFGEVSARAQENFSGVRVVKAYAQEDAELASFNMINAEYVRRSIAFARVNSLLWPAMYFISGLAVAILLWRGGVDVIAGRITLGRLVQFNTYLAALGWPMIALGWTVNLVQQGSASLSRITEVRSARPAIASAPDASPDARPIRGEIEFRHVRLSYDDRETLHDISLRVPAGSSLAIVGPTGSGKSSLVNLIARIYDVSAGSVLIDGHDVREIPLIDLRQSIGYVPQENFLFSLSIHENVGFGAPDMSDTELARALDVSQLANDVADFPAGVETMIGERGVTLSGGQKQRAGIARAVAKEPLILILDDSLSSVDTHTEAAILQRLRGVMAGRTSIVIAHRISTIKDLDQIIVLDDGRIVERGAHLDLIARGGLYASMYRRQLLAEELDDDVQEPGAPLDGASGLPASDAPFNREEV